MKAQECEWVIGSYKGETAKRVKALASEGLGYFVEQEVGRNSNHEVIVAFRRACVGPTPDHLIRVVDPKKIQRYEEMRLNRLGGYRGPSSLSDKFEN